MCCNAIPKRWFFIDDRAHNCEAAQALGIRAIRYQDEAQCVQALEQLGLNTGVRI
jgi:FMN phosphatase YigB (HAD superfamily)